MKVPWFVRLMMRPMKRSAALYKPMPPGRNIPRVPGGTLATDPLPIDEGVARIKQACARLKAGPPGLPHLLFGKLTHEEWINQHLRHAELHLSFLRA